MKNSPSIPSATALDRLRKSRPTRRGGRVQRQVGASVAGGVDMQAPNVGLQFGIDHVGMLANALLNVTESNKMLLGRLANLEGSIDNLKSKVDLCILNLPSQNEPENSLLDADASDERVLELVKSFFKSHKGRVFYPDEIAERLGLDTLRVIFACDALNADGDIDVAE